MNSCSAFLKKKKCSIFEYFSPEIGKKWKEDMKQ